MHASKLVTIIFILQKNSFRFNVPKTLGAMNGSWSWFMTAEDTLKIAEDGFLFYYFSTHLPKLIDASVSSWVRDSVPCQEKCACTVLAR
jgi:hypothetical protein